MERADPSIMRMAASIVSQFKSFIFCSAISRTCALVTEPATSRPGRLRAAFELRRLLEEVRHRRRAHFEGKRAVGIDRDGDGDRRALLQLLGLRVERLAELHDVEAALAERGPDRRRRIGRPRRHLQLDIAGDFLRHSLLLLVVRISTAGDRLTSHGLHSLHRFWQWQPKASPPARIPARPAWRGRRSTPRP